MKYYIIIPAHNEGRFMETTLQSLVNQTVRPYRIVVIDDHSTDNTYSIAHAFSEKYPFVSVIKNISESQHEPGSKVIRAFLKGLKTLDSDYDFIVKADADLIFPDNYFETIMQHFEADEKVGMAGGFAYIEKNSNWVLESLTGKDHIRGAFKAYRKECFKDIGGLQPAMGWDTLDELLALYHGWKIKTDESLKVKHLKPTGANYNRSAGKKQGVAFYSLGYGFLLTMIASLKLAFKKKKIVFFLDYVRGYFSAYLRKTPKLVNHKQEKFIRKYRWKKILEKFL
ncbi:MAG: glycosyltransferase family 2 protein [Flavobacterium sp.]